MALNQCFTKFCKLVIPLHSKSVGLRCLSSVPKPGVGQELEYGILLMTIFFFYIKIDFIYIYMRIIRSK